MMRCSTMIIILLFTIIVVTQAQRKPGDCPSVLDIGVCSMDCYSDIYCPGSLKCCRTSCGGSYCTPSVTPRISETPRGKAGNCPAKPMGPWVCSSRCGSDSDCRSNKKCCENRCGAMACTIPEMYRHY